MKERAKRIIDTEIQSKTGRLKLNGCSLDEIPVELLQMDWLDELILNNNKISEVKNLDALTNLQTLVLKANKISEIKGLDALTKLQTLDLMSNEIREIKNLDALTNLQTLDLAANKIREIKNLDALPDLQKLWLEGNKIREIKNLDELVNLEWLDLSNNDITEIKNLNRLRRLESINLNRNKISQIKNLDDLVNLKSLGLSFNDITEIKNLNRLRSLKKINLNNNKISEIKNLNKLSKLNKINLSENPITKIKQLPTLLRLLQIEEFNLYGIRSNDLQIPPEIFESGESHNCIYALKGYFESLQKGKFQQKEVPVILIGNSTAGKTSLRYFLQYNVYPPPEDHSTHGIEPSIWIPDEESVINLDEDIRPKDLQLYFWDFGGQEYYHATHRLFFSKKAIYILVWERKTNKQGVEILPVKIRKLNGEIEERELPVELFPYQYWVNSIRHRAENSKEAPIIMLQNKIDQDGNSKKENPDPVLLEKNNCESLQLSIKKAYELNGKGKKDPLVDILFREIFSAAKELASTITYGALWDDIKKMLQEMRDEKIWSPGKFLQELRKLDPKIHENSMLSYALSLRAIGFIIYEHDDAILKDYIFINPGWVTEVIYSILDYDILANKGEFDKTHVIKKAGNEYADTFIALMKKFELIFWNEELDNFIAPQYLPAELNDKRKSNELKARFDFDKPDFILQFTDFMPRYIMLRFLVAYGQQAKGQYYWKNGISFTIEKSSVLVLSDYDKKQFRVYTEDCNLYLQRLVFEKLVQLCENTKGLQVACGTDDFIQYLKLKEAINLQNERIKTESGKIIEVSSFKHFFTNIEALKGKFSKPSALGKESRKIRVFISYAHADNEKGLVDLFVKDLKAQLKVFEGEYEFDIFKDDKIVMGEEWNERLQKEAIAADIAILLLSSSFLQSEYIKKNELAIFLEKNKDTNANILCPIYFDPFLFTRYEILKKYQFFKPLGKTYGPEYVHLGDDLCYGDLVEFDPQSGLPLPNRNRSRYMVDFVQEVEKALKKKFE